MREIRQSGSEGGATSTIVPTPILAGTPSSNAIRTRFVKRFFASTVKPVGRVYGQKRQSFCRKTLKIRGLRPIPVTLLSQSVGVPYTLRIVSASDPIRD